MYCSNFDFQIEDDSSEDEEMLWDWDCDKECFNIVTRNKDARCRHKKIWCNKHQIISNEFNCCMLT